MKTEGEAQAGMWGKIGAAGAAAAIALTAVVAASVAIGVGAVKAASDFNSQMMLVRTQAHDTSDDIAWLGQQVLALAPTVGIGPDQLAEGLYHVTSVGYRGAEAISILKVAADGAKVGMANLDDTAYALTSTMNTFGLKGAQAQATMATLNAIVGAGDMKFQSLNAAISTGFLAAGETFGVSIQSMGAALAYLTDRGASADEAATRLKMSITLLGAPTKAAAGIMKDLGLTQSEVGQRTSAMEEALRKSGVTTTQLSADLRRPDGIQVALQDLVNHMQKAGLSADETAAVLSRAFGGGRSGAAIMSMVQHLDTLKSKFDMINEGQARFGSDVSDTMSTLNSRVDQVRAGFEAWRVELGEKLMPIANVVLGMVANAMPGIESTANRVADAITNIVTRTAQGAQGAGVAGGATGFLMALGMDSGTASTIGAQLAQIVQTVQQAASQIGPALKSIGSSMSTDFVPALKIAGPIVLDLAQGLSSTLGPALQLVSDHSNILVPLVTALAIGFGALKAIELAQTIGVWATNFATVATNIGKTEAVMSALGVTTGMQDALGWAKGFGQGALDAAGNFASMSKAAVVEGGKTAAAWVASAGRSAAAWVTTAASATTSFVATTVAAGIESTKTAVAWLAAQAKIAAGWVATQAKAAASYVATVAEANPNSVAAVLVWLGAQIKIAAGWVAAELAAMASYARTAAAAGVAAAQTAASWVAARAAAVASFVATAVAAGVQAVRSAAVWIAAQVSMKAGWALSSAAAIGSFVATAAAAAAQAALSAASWLAAALALGVVRVATLAWMAAQWLLDAALNANPISLVIIGIALLVVGIVVLITHWKQVVQWLSLVWDWIKKAAASISDFIDKHRVLALAIGLLGGPITMTIGLVALLITHWNQVASAANEVWHALQGFGSWLSGTFGPIIQRIADLVGGAADKLNGFVSAAKSVPGVAGLAHAAGVPGFAGGGIVTRPTLAMVGEAGPELIVPLSTVNQGAGAVSLAPAYPSSGSGSGPTVELHTHIQLGNEEFAELVQRIQDGRLSGLMAAT